tara:strand:+ start:12199 stop:12330 length:132 start_codon:yes stop_codon:yes gene_type:complete
MVLVAIEAQIQFEGCLVHDSIHMKGKRDVVSLVDDNAGTQLGC